MEEGASGRPVAWVAARSAGVGVGAAAVAEDMGRFVQLAKEMAAKEGLGQVGIN